VPQIKLGEAARLAGRSRSTIHRAMEAGRLSYTIDGNGERLIDPAELARIFEIKSVESEEVALRNSSDTERHSARLDSPDLVAQLAAERARADGLEDRLADRDKVIADRDEVIADLRRRLDRAGERLDQADEERRAIQARLTALLTDQRPPRRGWWPWRWA
jgi:predicted site-specific integrase-resolvase